MALLYQIALVKIKTFGHGKIVSISEVIRINDFSKSTYDEIGSYLDTEFQRKSSPTWIPNSKGNQLLLGYRFPKEIGSNVDADIPDKFRIFETSFEKNV
ncbi:uncharacterized protein OCT59_022502 [Rhizophagus irregularis]|uniref:uncharacterized protein n=1 Tax=Rhizophagus irregularis TaxID=588596 RepID=UPI003317896B|nr:hypothetical protein OCT59_022502 [Rhizophagus irregularis]